MNRAFKLLIATLIFAGTGAYAQCPENIGFEDGSLKNWKTYIGEVMTNGTIMVDETFQPESTRHQIMAASSEEVDPYGKFPTVSPNGSKFSVKLGNSGGNHQAERLSYTLTVPNIQQYNLVLNYAIVLQNPNHNNFEQPRFTVKVFNITDNEVVMCPAFDFIASDALPGFEPFAATQTIRGQETITYGSYKDWTSTTIDLSAYQGKQIRLDFTTNDCTFNAHFGYAYFDINENCKDVITGNVICENQERITLQGPKGFSAYTWFMADDMNTPIWDKQSLVLSPVPAVGTKYVLKVGALTGLGCSGEFTTVITRIGDPYFFDVKPIAYFCPGTTFNLTAPSVTAGSVAGLTFEYYTDDVTQAYLRNPEKITEPGIYYIRGTNAGGCTDVRRIELKFYDAVNFSPTDPAPVQYPATIDLRATYSWDPTYKYFYFSDEKFTKSVTEFRNISVSGKYYMKAVSASGCEKNASVNVLINPPPPNIISGPTVFTPNNDGINDYFNLTIKGFVDFGTLSIFNRAGQFLFKTTKLSATWDGNFNGRSLPPGTYYWLFEGTDQYYHTKINKGGYVSIIK
jgi:gliding motility-associated-like protein